MKEEEVAAKRRRGPPRWLTIPLAVFLGLLLLALVYLWLVRVQLATDYLDREFARRGVEASYDVKRIGFGTQRFENLVIGDPDDPDLTARIVNVRIRIGLGGPSVGLITARGVRLRGRLVGDRVSFGQVDRLLPPPTGLPFRLPDQEVDIADTALVLDTPAGRLAASIAGRGNLADGFRGQMALFARRLDLGTCRLEAPDARFHVAVDRLRPSLRGPARLERLRCGEDIEVESPRFALAATLAPALNAWRGEARGQAGRFRAGPTALGGASGELSFAGNRRATRGRVSVEAAAARLSGFGAARTRVAGDYALSLARGDFTLDGEVASAGIFGGERALAPIVGGLDSLGGTPLEPIGDALAAAVLRAGRGADAEARLRLAARPEGGVVAVRELRVRSRSGLRLALSGDNGLVYAWPGGRWRVDGDLALSGGGFPDARFTLRQERPGGPVLGVGRIAPYAADGARIELSQIRISAGPGQDTRIDSFALIDGPIPDGRVEGLAMPVALRLSPAGGLLLGESCTPARWRSLAVSGLRIGPTSLRLCPVGPALIWRPAGGRVRAVADLAGQRFAGTIGGTPIRFGSDSLRFDFTDFGFTAANPDIVIGPGDGAVRVRMARFSGSFVGNDLTGPFAGLAGDIAGVPLLVDQAEGSWRLRGGALHISGSLRVSDAEAPARFHPLVSEDFSFVLADNRIRAEGWLQHPATATRVARADIGHDLNSGAGRAVLDVPGLAFGPNLQPEDITPLTEGVVALVDGVVTGRGLIEWDQAGTRSSGTFGTEGMNLAAPFGPVEGLTTTVRFTDLLGLVSAPGQIARIDLVRTGIDVFDGTIRYQLQPDQNVRIEGGQWPFAGGELFLEPTTLDFSQPSARYLTFRVVGLDAAAFVQQMEFGNIAATGTFDGVVPMIFDITGGRIVGGRMEARPPGGTLSYIGELTDRDLGVYGKLAFDALKSLRYSRFEIALDGSLDGEFLTRIQLDGVARDASVTPSTGGGITGMIAGHALRQLARIPFRFNIAIRGPFRALIGTARSFDDPSLLIQPVLPRFLRDLPTDVNDIQHEESETVR